MPASVIIPAYRAADSIAETVRAARQITGVGEVIVVDDGSRDGTDNAARAAGADQVIILPDNRGKGAALAAGLAAAKHENLLLLDADLRESAAQAGPLLDAITEPSMSVAVLRSRPGAGGLGFALALARFTIRLLSGLRPVAPMSGQRALPADLVRRIGLAPRFGVEVALTIETAHLGVPIHEVSLPLEHARTGRTLAGFLHRARQFKDILAYLLLAGYGLGWPALSKRRKLTRAAAFLVTLLLVAALGRIASPPATALTAASIAAALVLWLPVLWITAVWMGLRKPNYLERRIPAGAGLLFPLVGLPALWLSPVLPRALWSGLLVIGVLGFVGLLDDVFAAGHRARGLRGHFLALRRGRLTTGAIKALGGLAAALGAGLLLDPGRAGAILTDALLIALCANFVNLLDLRPGRALKGFLLLCLPALAVSPASIHLLGPLLGAAAVSAPGDMSGRAMMGDVGANVLGGAGGLALALALSPWDRLAVVLLLVAIHLLCEKHSLTEIIARNRCLSSLDELGCAHLAPYPAKEGAGS